MAHFLFVVMKEVMALLPLDKNYYLCIMTGIIILSIASAVILVLCAIILSGKGDHLIAGFKTAKEEERRQYNIKRLRLVVALICFFPILVCWIPFVTDNIFVILFAVPIFCFITLFGGIILIDSWCKKK